MGFGGVVERREGGRSWSSASGRLGIPPLPGGIVVVIFMASSVAVARAEVDYGSCQQTDSDLARHAHDAMRRGLDDDLRRLSAGAWAGCG